MPHRSVLPACLAAILWISDQQHAWAEPAADHCVILVSVDGLAGFYLDDPRADMPTLRRLAKEGARASGMVCSFPTVTWPNHTTLVTGAPPARHGVIGNSFLDRATQKTVSLLPDPVLDKDQIVKVPTVYDAAHEAGLKTAAIIWPATRNARSLDWTVPDMAGDAWTRFGTASWLAELREAGLPVNQQGPWVAAPTGGVQRDWLYVRMAAQVLEKHAPNLLLIHLVETDHVEHRAGPRSDDAYWAVSYADDRLRDLVEAIARSPKKQQTTLFVCSDHGFFPIDKEIRPNVLLRQLGLIPADAQAKKTAVCLSQGGACAVYVLDDGRRGEIVAQLRDQLARIEGVEAVFAPEQFGEIGQPTLAEDPHAADLWLAARSGYSFADTSKDEAVVVLRDSKGGAHGYLPEHSDLEATCVMWGAGIKPGTSLGRVSNLDVAPTIARLLGIELPSAEGKPLVEALAK
ncbi:MAG TPA: ectonucleotide pyrophosphatase/phosphodiesterase [Pirellulales bacterium]|jgi:predicted AlkP superfamily pyrophosphatase or phosphodiesterase|nr:ectonucleotide pyrophosphatase/phosphodiesterase [Pirellulales bacterium]